MTERPTDHTTEARLRDFLSSELARARLDFPDLAPRSRPRPTSSFAPVLVVSVMAVIALVAAGLLESRSWTDRQGGVAAPSPSPTASCEPEDLDRFLESIQIATVDYDPFDTPRDQAAAADLVVVGRFVAADPGRSDDSPGQQRGRLTVAVETVIAGDRSAVQDGHVFVELPMQPSDIETARDSLPANRVMLFLDSSGDPSIFAPFVQGVVLETCPGYVSALDSLEGMSAAWRQAANFDEFVALASPSTAASPSPALGTVDVLLVRVEPPPSVFPSVGGHVTFVEIRQAGGGELLHELRLRDENTTVELVPGLYTISTRVDVQGDVLLEGESEPPIYGEVARCADEGLEVLSGLTTTLTVTIEEPDGTCRATAGSPGQSQRPSPSPTGAPAPPGGARLRIQPTVEDWLCTPAGCKYYADLMGPAGSNHRMELSLGGGLDLPVVGPDQILPVLLDPGRYRLTLESHVIDDVSFNGQPPEVTLGARCVESFDVVPGQTEIDVTVAFRIDACVVTTTLEPD